MDPQNRYAPTQASMDTHAAPAGIASDVAVWRDGTSVVARRGAPLPPRCVKCNAPADLPTKFRTLSWVPPAYYLLIVAGGILFVIVFAVFARRAAVNPGLCRRHKRRRGAALGYCVVGGFIWFATASIGIAEDSVGASFLGSAIAVGVAWGRLVHARKMTPGEVRLGGCAPAYLDGLPDYPGR